MRSERIEWRLTVDVSDRVPHAKREPVMLKNTRFRKTRIAAAGVAIAIVLFSLISTPSALAQGVKILLVQVANDASHPVPVFDVQAPPCSPFQTELVLAPSSGQPSETQSFLVPRDKRLVIEHVSADAFGNGFISAHVNTTVGGLTVEHFLVTVQQGTTSSGAPVFRISQPTRWYADAGTEVAVTAAMTPPNGAVTLVSISGCLVDS